jgi:hypothetical protein
LTAVAVVEPAARLRFGRVAPRRWQWKRAQQDAHEPTSRA